MKKITLLVGFIVIVFYSCKLNNSSNSNSAKDSITTSKAIEFETSDKVVLSFLIWYRDNFNKMNSFCITSDKDDSTHIINGKWGDSTVYYTVNFKGAEKFLKVLSSSGFLSTKFLDEKRKSFKERADELVKARQSDGPPLGFSAEEIFYLNDIEETVFPLVNKAKVIQIKLNNRSAIYKVDIFENKKFKLSNYDGKWLIDEIIQL